MSWATLISPSLRFSVTMWMFNNIQSLTPNSPFHLIQIRNRVSVCWNQILFMCWEMDELRSGGFLNYIKLTDWKIILGYLNCFVPCSNAVARARCICCDVLRPKFTSDPHFPSHPGPQIHFTSTFYINTNRRFDSSCPVKQRFTASSK